MPNDIAISDKLPGKLITLADMLVHSTIIEQMKLLQLFWTSGDPILTSDDPTLDALQVRMKQRYVSATIVGGYATNVLARRLFWTTAIGDSCWAAATGQPPKLYIDFHPRHPMWATDPG